MLLTVAVGAVGVTGATWVLAQESSPATGSPPSAAQPAVPGPAPQAAVASQNTPQLSYGMAEVMKLLQAKISDPTILAYIQNSRTAYNLSASEVVYLKQQGVSDAVLTAMLNQRGGPAIAAQSTPPSSNAEVSAAPVVTTAPAPSTAYVTQAQPSTVYVVSDPPVYYDPYPYYGYYGWPFPGLALSFGWGGRFGGFHGGGGDFHGGGFHGGGGGGFHGGGHR